MLRLKWLAVVCFVLLLLLLWLPGSAQKSPKALKVAHLSDTHLGLGRAPQADENLKKAVEMIRQRRPDVVLVSGDVGERPQAWADARQILSPLDAPVLFVPGNHDVKSDSMDRYRRHFGEDYYTLTIGHVTFVALNSQLLGNYDRYEEKRQAPLPAATERQAEKMLGWLKREVQQARKSGGRKGRGGAGGNGEVVVAVQHIPFSRAGEFPSDRRPYWTAQEPYRSRATELLKRMGVRQVFAGHWHRGMVFEADGLVHRVAPSTSWLPMGGKLGFAMHTIEPDGDVSTEFVYLDGSTERARP